MSKHGSEVISQADEDQNQPQLQSQEGATLMVKIMIGFLYFAQGFIFAISATTPYTYPTLPDYITLSLFTLSPLSYSFKFVTAPILQKFTSLSYGKRKTWIVISQLIATVFILICAFHSQMSQAQTFALICFFIYFTLSLQDISLDALCLKQLKSTKMMSIIQSACQSSGVIIGGLILLKGTSLQFAQRIGLESPITTLKTILIGSAATLFISTMLVHFRFNQTQVPAQARSTKSTLLQVYSIYRYFFKLDYRYCRTAIFLLFFNQGFNFFYAGYTYELIQNGFSRDTLNTIQNCQNVIVTLLIFLLGYKATVMGFKTAIILVKTLALLLAFFLWIFFPTAVMPIIFTNFVNSLLHQWQFLITTPICANFPETGATGMLYTMNASSGNFGRNKFVHTAILKRLPWRTVALVGLIIQIPLNYVFIPKMMDLIEEGKTEIREFEEDEQNEIQKSPGSDETKQKQHSV